PRRLQGMPAASVTATMIKNYAAQVSGDTGLAEDVAHWAIEAWVCGLGLGIAGAHPAEVVRPSDRAVQNQRMDRRAPSRRACPYCGAVGAGVLCPSCGRDTTAPRRPCPTCGKMVPSSESACWNCGTKFRSDLMWKIPLIVALFALAAVVSIVIGLIK